MDEGEGDHLFDSRVIVASHRIVPGRVVRHSHCERTCEKHNNYTTPAYVYANYVRHRQSIHTQEVENAPESTTHSPDHASAPDTCQLNPQSILSIIVDDAETQEHLFHLVRKTNLHRAMSINASRSRMHYRKHVNQGITGCRDASANTIASCVHRGKRKPLSFGFNLSFYSRPQCGS